MKPSITNAFILPGPDRRPSAGSPTRRLRPLMATLTEAGFGWNLRLSPVRAIDVAPIWCRISPGQLTMNLVYGVAQYAWVRPEQPLTIGEIADRLSIVPEDRFDDNHLVVGDRALRPLLGVFTSRRVRIARIEGPIEAIDALVIGEAPGAGLSALDVEVRAVAAIEIVRDRSIDLHTRRRSDALAFVADTFRQYVSALIDEPVSTGPERRQLGRLFDTTESITLRPIETDLHDTSIDLGIATGDNPGPANRSMIFDRPSESWHDEP